MPDSPERSFPHAPAPPAAIRVRRAGLPGKSWAGSPWPVGPSAPIRWHIDSVSSLESWRCRLAEDRGGIFGLWGWDGGARRG